MWHRKHISSVISANNNIEEKEVWQRMKAYENSIMKSVAKINNGSSKRTGEEKSISGGGKKM